MHLIRLKVLWKIVTTFLRNIGLTAIKTKKLIIWFELRTRTRREWILGSISFVNTNGIIAKEDIWEPCDQTKYCDDEEHFSRFASGDINCSMWRYRSIPHFLSSIDDAAWRLWRTFPCSVWRFIAFSVVPVSQERFPSCGPLSEYC